MKLTLDLTDTELQWLMERFPFLLEESDNNPITFSIRVKLSMAIIEAQLKGKEDASNT